MGMQRGSKTLAKRTKVIQMTQEIVSSYACFTQFSRTGVVTLEFSTERGARCRAIGNWRRRTGRRSQASRVCIEYTSWVSLLGDDEDHLRTLDRCAGSFRQALQFTLPTT